MANPIHVLSAEQLTPALLGRLRAVSPRLVIEQRPADTAAAIEQALTPHTEVLLTGRANFRLAGAPALRWVQLVNAGVNHAHDTELWRSDIMLTNASGVHAAHLPQYVLAVMLAHAFHLPLAQRLQARHAWAAGAEKRLTLMPAELRGRTIGIVGYGAIGRELGRLSQALGMRVLATKRAGRAPEFDGWTPAGTGDPSGSIPARYYDLGELHALLAASDVVVLALPLVDSTRHIVGAAELAAMRPGALLVNIGRGPLIDQNALIEALRGGRISAALDVTDPEPLPADSPLWDFENVQITPHISGMSEHYDELATELFAENLRRYLDGQPLLNTVERERGY